LNRNTFPSLPRAKAQHTDLAAVVGPGGAELGGGGLGGVSPSNRGSGDWLKYLATKNPLVHLK
jgi:hypothetical protein